MTLADFARSIGISPATARQWKRRGKITERDGQYFAARDGVTARDGASVTGSAAMCDAAVVALQARVTALECENADLRARVEGLEAQLGFIWTRLGQSDVQRIYGTASKASGPIDPPGPVWGA